MTCLIVPALLTSVAIVQAASPAQLVRLELCVAEQVPERVEASLTNPLEKLLLWLPGVAELSSNTGHGGASLEIRFARGATEDDRASVELALERSEDLMAQVLSRSIRLAEAHKEDFVRGSRSCIAGK